MRGPDLIVNGRFLAGSAAGIHRVGRGLVDAARGAGLPFEVFAPAGSRDPRVDREMWAPPGRAGAHIWEQILLPAAARGRPVVSLGNTGPIAVRRSALMVHDLGWRVDPSWFSRSGRLYGRLAWAAARRAGGVLTPSEHVRGELIAAGFDPAILFVVRNAVAEDLVRSPDEAVASLRDRIQLAGPYLVVVGWADPRKDAALAIRAHLDAVRSIEHTLVLVGRPHPNFGPVSLPEAPTVRRLGYLAEPDLRALLSGASALVFPSRYEGFGLPPLEALTLGVPAIVSDIPVLRESTAGAAHYVAAGDQAAWTDAMRAALDGGIRPGSPPSWRWSDAARQLADALTSLGFL
jgi:glycosyltransferase involved in cell wall biosynthesis